MSAVTHRGLHQSWVRLEAKPLDQYLCSPYEHITLHKTPWLLLTGAGVLNDNYSPNNEERKMSANDTLWTYNARFNVQHLRQSSKLGYTSHAANSMKQQPTASSIRWKWGTTREPFSRTWLIHCITSQFMHMLCASRECDWVVSRSCMPMVWLVCWRSCKPRCQWRQASRLPQGRATQPTVHAACFSVSLIHRILTWTKRTLTCAQTLLHAMAYRGARTTRYLWGYACFVCVRGMRLGCG